MTEIRQLPAQQERVETGPVQFGDDWPGVFIRGDHAGWYAMNLKHVLESDLPLDFLLASNLRNLQQDLAGCVVGPCREMVVSPAGGHANSDTPTTEPPNFACPCLLADEPCRPKCSCRNPESSFACLACAGYGSADQRKQQASRIIQAVRRIADDGTTQQ